MGRDFVEFGDARQACPGAYLIYLIKRKTASLFLEPRHDGPAAQFLAAAIFLYARMVAGHYPARSVGLFCNIAKSDVRWPPDSRCVT